MLREFINMLNNSSPNIANIFCCETCDYKCSKQSDYNKHLLTRKHEYLTTVNTSVTQNSHITHKCTSCNKVYKSRVGLWYHKNKCKIDDQTTNHKNELVETNLIVQLIKQNQEFKDMLMEQHKSMIDAFSDAIKQNNSITNNINSNNNSNNKTFNLQLFLYEDCKDAMNLSEFLESIKIQLADVEAVGELGYVNGISKLIIQNLKGLDVTKRPIHCTDEKREIVYIKEAGVWTKDEDCSKLRRLIKCVSNRNFKHTRLYKEKHPDCITAESKYSDTYNKIIIEATGGGSKCNDFESENKIMKKIAKAITIDKSDFLTNA
jgi:hypothetical protein